MTREPVKIGLAGCGALTESYYAPSLVQIQKSAGAQVVSIFDPSPQRLALIGETFPSAKRFSKFEDFLTAGHQLVIVASPAKFHAEQSISLLKSGCFVLCEKPMAATVAEAESMLKAPGAGDRLTIGLFRRFFPALRTVQEYIADESLGKAVRFEFTEGGVFNWPAQSASFFQKATAGGGVFLDLGVHMLDLALWWHGEPTGVVYEDDAMGGLEINARAKLTFASGVTGTVQLSRDWDLPNEYRIEFERGTLVWRVGDANGLELITRGRKSSLRGTVWSQGKAALNYSEAFVAQLLNCIAAVGGREPIVVPGSEGIRSLRLIEQCYSRRKLMNQPWLSQAEMERAQALAAA